MNDETPAPRPADAVEFLRAIKPAGPWCLSAACPVGKHRFETRAFTPAQNREAAEFIRSRNLRKLNIYFSLAEPRGLPDRKAGKEDMQSSTLIWADLDPSEEGDLAIERQQIAARLEREALRPTWIIDSGRGYWALYRLDTTVEFDGAKGQRTVDFEGRMRALAARLSADRTACEVSKIGRLPFTINWPNAKKEAQGATPRLAIIVEASGKLHSLAAFPGEAPSGPARTSVSVPIVPGKARSIADLSDLREWRVPDRILTILQHGRVPGEGPKDKDDSRSAWMFDGVCGLLRSGVPDDIIMGILLDARLGISDHILAQPGSTQAYARKQVEAARRAMATDWHECTKGGRPIKSYMNARAAILRLGITCEYNLFHNRRIIGGHPLHDRQSDLTEDVCAVIRQVIVDAYGFDPGKEHVRDAAHALCLENDFDPVLDYLEGLVWDGVPRLDTWAIRYLGASDSSLSRAIGRILLVAAVRRARRPGCKFDHIVVLEGNQGSGKSTALRILAGDAFFSDQDLLHLDHRAQQEATGGVWIFELSELAGLNRAGVNKVKAFASRTHDRARAAYAAHTSDQPRRCIFVGTTNESEYLQDPTGNRRFWPLRTGKIDLAALRQDRDQLWAEAASVDRAEPAAVLLPQELWEAAAARQEGAREVHPWMVLLAEVRGAVHGGEERIASQQLLTEVLKIPAAQMTLASQRVLADCMKRLGWVNKKLRVGGESCQGYARPLDPNDVIRGEAVEPY